MPIEQELRAGEVDLGGFSLVCVADLDISGVANVRALTVGSLRIHGVFG